MGLSQGMERNPQLIKKLLQKSEGMKVDLSEFDENEVIYHYYLLFENKAPEEMDALARELSSKNPGWKILLIHNTGMFFDQLTILK